MSRARRAEERRARWRALATVAVTMLGGACGTSFEPSGASGGGGGGEAGAVTTSTVITGGAGGAGGTSTSTDVEPVCVEPKGNECQLCLSESCADAFCACGEVGGCLDIADCLEKGNPLEICWQQSPGAISRFGLLQVCALTECDACAYPDVEPCEACQYAECPELVNGCFSTGECLGYLKCVFECAGEPLCEGGCLTEFPNGKGPAQELVECTNAHCADCQ